MFKYLALNFFRVVYSFRFEFLGKRCRLVGPLLLAGAQRIRIQNEVRLEMFASLSTASGGHINIGERTEIGAFARIDADSGHIQIGNDSSVNAFCNLNGYGGLLIGRNVRIASHAVILSHQLIVLAILLNLFRNKRLRLLRLESMTMFGLVPTV